MITNVHHWDSFGPTQVATWSFHRHAIIYRVVLSHPQHGFRSHDSLPFSCSRRWKFNQGSFLTKLFRLLSKHQHILALTSDFGVLWASWVLHWVSETKYIYICKYVVYIYCKKCSRTLQLCSYFPHYHVGSLAINSPTWGNTTSIWGRKSTVSSVTLTRWDPTSSK